MPARGRGFGRGYLLVGAAACCWGASATLGRGLFTGQVRLFGAQVAPVGPLVLTQFRITLAAAMLLAILLWRRRGRVLLPWPDLWRAASLGVLGMTASNYFYYLAIQRTNVATAIILQYTAPIWVLVYMVARGRQRATAARAGAVLLALTGIALVLGLASGGSLQLDGIGVAAATVAAFAFAYYNVGGQQLSIRADPVLISLAMLLGGACVCLMLSPPWSGAGLHYSAAQWEFMLLFSLLATLAPTLLYISGLKYLDATRAVVTSCLEPVSGILLAASFLGEGLSWQRAAGVGCVLGAIVLTTRDRRAAGAP